MDGFEIRVRFKEMLERLTVSDRVIAATANYCLSHREESENLYDCIYEHCLHQENILERLSSLYVLDRICVDGSRGNLLEYVDFVKRDLKEWVGLIAPEDNTIGNANIHGLKKVLLKWSKQSILDPAALGPIIEELNARELAAMHASQSPEDKTLNGRTGTGSGAGSVSAAGSGAKQKRIDSKDILARIEEDRERHKRIKEDNWNVHLQQPDKIFDRCCFTDPELDEEFVNAWGNLSEFNEADSLIIRKAMQLIEASRI